MPGKVAPINSEHPARAIATPGPIRTATNTGSHSEQPSPCQNALCTFIDAALNICSIDTTDTTLNNSNSSSMRMMSPTRGECSVQDDDDDDWGQRRYKLQQNQQQQKTAVKLDTSQPIIYRSFGSGSSSSSYSSPLFRRATSDLHHGQETVILPHLRFNTLPSSSSTSSSLQDFYALFLADNAPHSFQLFHESYGDENVVVTPWKTKKHSTNNNYNPYNDNTILCEEDECHGLETTSSQRTITYQTKISPGSSSNPLVVVSPSTGPPSNTTSSNNNIIPLAVTIVQTLIKNPNNMTWVLHCEFSFDFHNSSSSPPPASSSSSSIASSIINNSTSGGGSSSSSVGKKLLGTGGLSQYFMSHVVKGSTVNVSIIMKECDEGVDGAEHIMRDASTTTTTSIHRVVTGATTTTKTKTSNHQHTSSQESCQENIYSWFSHPLLLPPDGLCGSGARETSSWRTSSMCNSNCIITEEPSKIGASLLSAIRAKNASSASDFSSSNKTVADVSLVVAPPASHPEGGVPSDLNITAVKRRGQEEEDVLAYCSSRGNMKVKNIPSELSRAPSTISMRRMILDKTEATRNSEGLAKRSSSIANPIQTRHHDGSLFSSDPSSKFTRGISMRIQMELADSSSSTHPSSTLSFSRSPSIPTIDDKIRRGLKKRFARSWVSWAESWCMRVWEEEEAERIRKRTLGMAMVPESTKRNKVNVRPNVRRIGDLEGKKKTRDLLTPLQECVSTFSSSVSTKDDVWKEMNVENSPTRKNERWISREGRDDECGVEVECTVVVQQTQQKRRLKAVDINQRKEQAIRISTVKSSGLLKQRRTRII